MEVILSDAYRLNLASHSCHLYPVDESICKAVEFSFSFD
jgi:hypothetical protein